MKKIIAILLLVACAVSTNAQIGTRKWLFSGTKLVPNWSAGVGFPGSLFVAKDSLPTISTPTTHMFVGIDSSNGKAVKIPFTTLGYQLLFSDTSTTTVGNTTTEATLLGNGIGTLNFPNITAGSSLVLKGSGLLKTAAIAGSPTFTFTVGTTSLAMSLTGLASALNNDYFDYEFYITPKTTGTNQVAIYRCKVFVNNNGSPKTFVSSSAAGVLTTTGTVTANVTGDWDTADADNVITSQMNTVEVFRK